MAAGTTSWRTPTRMSRAPPLRATDTSMIDSYISDAATANPSTSSRSLWMMCNSRTAPSAAIGSSAKSTRPGVCRPTSPSVTPATAIIGSTSSRPRTTVHATSSTSMTFGATPMMRNCSIDAAWSSAKKSTTAPPVQYRNARSPFPAVLRLPECLRHEAREHQHVLQLREARQVVDVHVLEEILLRLLHVRYAADDDSGRIAAADPGGDDEVAVLHRRALPHEFHIQLTIVVAGDYAFGARLLHHRADGALGICDQHYPGIVVVDLRDRPHEATALGDDDHAFLDAVRGAAADRDDGADVARVARDDVRREEGIVRELRADRVEVLGVARLHRVLASARQLVGEPLVVGAQLLVLARESACVGEVVDPVGDRLCSVVERVLHGRGDAERQVFDGIECGQAARHHQRKGGDGEEAGPGERPCCQYNLLRRSVAAFRSWRRARRKVALHRC